MDIFTKLRAWNLELRNEQFTKLMSPMLKQLIFEETDNVEPIVGLGSLSGTNTILYDSINIAASTGARPAKQRRDFMRRLTSVLKEISINFELMDKDSKEIIDKQLNNILVVTVAFSLSLLLLFLLFYWPFLHEEKNRLKKMQYLIMMVGNMSGNKNINI